ncbi:3444_t:CDS:2 [Diversispora eburnea]|uniref:3444_t:CDS:1 n=1 Tax=Diversispora eburnea TaxID=1213867 RepID=A0A9N8ZBX8_9GLOM|nr:3444_t:CDS:2 [Diversispora eburnea]
MSLLLNSSSLLKKSIIGNLGNKILIIRTYQDKVKRQKTVPLPRGSIDTPQRFLEKIGRGCEDVADKFRVRKNF